MTTKPRIISLDLDDTLWPVGPVIAAAEATLLSWLEARHPHAARGHSVDSMRELRARAAEQFPERAHDLTFLRRHALAQQFGAAVDAGAPVDERLVEEALEVFMEARNRVEFYADVRPALVRLRTRHRLFAVSNGNADLRRCGIADLFDGHITARAAGAAKPDARIFAELLRAARSLDAGVLAADVLHVGDDPAADVVGAMRAGMQAVWLNRDGREWPRQLPPPPRTVSTLAEIF